MKFQLLHAAITKTAHITINTFGMMKFAMSGKEQTMIINREKYEKLSNLVDAQRELINALKMQITFLEKQNQVLEDLNQLLKKQIQTLKDMQFDKKGADNECD